jgi:hypothetical protein
MRVTLENRPTGLSGKVGELVYCYHRREGIIIARRYTYPTITEHNKKVGSISANLFGIKPSSCYKQDLYFYIDRFNGLRDNRQNQMRSWVNVYLKLMYAMAKADPSIELRTLTREEIVERDLPCLTLKKAIEAGLLPQVYGWESFTHEI